MDAEDVGGVHVKYLHHCPRQLWLYVRGVRPEFLSELVQYGEAVDETTFTRASPVDLGAARLDYIDGETWVHEVKSAVRPQPGDGAQVIHYCYRLHRVGVPARGGILHYPRTRRTVRVAYGPEQEQTAQRDIAEVLRVAARAEPPPRLPQARCQGCSFRDYCWAGEPGDTDA